MNRNIKTTVISPSTRHPGRGSIQAGGGTIPTITYRLKVAETFRGAAAGEIEVTMVTDPPDTAPYLGAAWATRP
jgi:hypothetical protein